MDKYNWSIEDIFSSIEEFYKTCEEIENKIDFSEFKGKLNDAKTFLACMKKQEELARVLDKLSVYAMMMHDIDTSSSTYDALMSKVMSLGTKYSQSAAFIVPELTALPEETLKGYIENPLLKEYDYSLKGILKTKAHILSESEEKLLALASEPFSCFKEIFTKIDNADLPLTTITHKGEKIELSHGTYGLIMHGTDRALRQKCFKAYYKAYKDLLNTISSTYIGSVKKDVFFTRARNYNSTMERALIGEDVSPKVYEKLLTCVHKALPDLHDYIAEKKKVSKYKKFNMYDIYAPVCDGVELKLSYDDAFELVKEGLAPLGKDYVELLDKAKNERWISVYETKNKRSGAYSVCVYDTHPYVLLNYKETTHDVFTIAHELGHAMHSYYSNKNQPYSKADYRIFVAEVASTVNETLLIKHLLKNATDNKLKKYLSSYLLEMIRTTVFRQTMFSEFEEYSHSAVENNLPLTKDSMNEKYLSLNKTYYGNAVISNEEIAYEWARIPHFYRSFYVYKYATGLISALAIADRILTEGESAVNDYKKFLSSGGSDSPVELLKIAGVDLLTDEPYEKAFKTFNETLKDFKEYN